jgi:hypothetical protein
MADGSPIQFDSKKKLVKGKQLDYQSKVQINHIQNTEKYEINNREIKKFNADSKSHISISESEIIDKKKIIQIK